MSKRQRSPKSNSSSSSSSGSSKKTKRSRSPPKSPKECQVCLDHDLIPGVNVVQCPVCRGKWCTACDRRLWKCPFCSFEFPERQEQASQERSAIIREYDSQPWMMPSPDMNILSRLMSDPVVAENFRQFELSLQRAGRAMDEAQRLRSAPRVPRAPRDPRLPNPPPISRSSASRSSQRPWWVPAWWWNSFGR